MCVCRKYCVNLSNRIFMNRSESRKEPHIVPEVRKGRLGEIDEGKEDIQYWQSRPAIERIAAVTFLVFQSIPKGERMDKSVVVKRKFSVK